MYERDNFPDTEIDNLREESKRMKSALDDIAKGMVPAGEMPSLDDKHEFRYKMWQWSQKRAREGLGEQEDASTKV